MEDKHYLASRSKRTKFEHYPLKEEVIALLKDNNFNKPTMVQA
jgi:superfamily II DNA/RNA helicase